MRRKRKQGSRRFPWSLVVAALSSAACGSPPPADTPSTLPPPKAASAKSGAKRTPGTDSVEIVAAHVTAADVAIAPDGKWLAFNALGHLYRLSAKGGDAEQLTFGPYYDREPAISPDGRRLAFVSNRDPTGLPSLFLLNLSTGEISEIKGAVHASQPSWSPDGKALSFLSRPPTGAPQARWVELGAGRIYTRSEPGPVEAVGFLNDGRLVWAAREPGAATSQLLALDKSGQATTELNVKGAVLDIVRNPESDSVYLELQRAPSGGPADPEPTSIVSVRLPGGEPKPVTSVEAAAPNARFSATGGELWLCERGTLWRVDATTGKKQPLRLSFEASLEVLPRAKPSWSGPAAGPMAPLDPRVIPKSGDLLFTAAGFLWHQAAGASRARRALHDLDGLEWGPAAPSPDGARVAVQVTRGFGQELRIVDLLKGVTLRTVVTSERSVNFQPAWHPNGTELAYVAPVAGVPHIHLVELPSAKHSTWETRGTWQPTPHFSSDGAWLYYTHAGQVMKLPLKGTGKVVPLPVTSFTTPIERALVAPDGNSVAFGRGDELWWAPANSNSPTVGEEAARRLSDSGGRNFSFAPSPSPTATLVYGSGREIMQQTVGSERRVLATLQLPPMATEPLLVRNARPIDFERGRFQDPVSIYIDKGRIQWIGAEKDHKFSPEARILDAAGRFALPGLIDLGTSLAPHDSATAPAGIAQLAAFLAFGVTTVLDVDGDSALLQGWNDRRSTWGAAIPRILHHRPIIKTVTYASSGVLSLTEDELRARVRMAKAAGANGISAAPELPWPLQRALADEAAKQGLLVSGAGRERDQLITSALLGHWSVPGLSGATPYADDLVQLLAKTQTTLITSLSAPWGNPVLFRQDAEQRSDSLLAAFTSAAERRAAPDWTRAITPELRQQAYDRTLGGYQLAHHGNVRAAVGSGAPDADCFYGHCLHTELWHLAEARLTPLQVLRRATLGNAEALGAAGHLGSLEPGKLADLVLLDKDPLANLRNTLSIAYVISDGRPFQRGAPFHIAPPTTAAPKSKL